MKREKSYKQVLLVLTRFSRLELFLDFACRSAQNGYSLCGFNPSVLGTRPDKGTNGRAIDWRGTVSATIESKAATSGTAWRLGASGLALLVTLLLPLGSGCGGAEGSTDEQVLETAEQPVQEEFAGFGGGSSNTPKIGIALEVEDGEGMPLRVRAGQTVYINQIDIRSTLDATKDEGVDGLRRTGDFACLGWNGVKLADESFDLLAGEDGFKRRRFYRDAAWMDVPSAFTVEPVDAQGRLTGLPILLFTGSNDRKDSDDFFVRRFRAIQWTYGCRTSTDCTGSNSFLEEGLLELRNARTPAKNKTITLNSQTKALRLRWTLRPFSPYTIPVEQVSQPKYSYGFGIDVTPVTPPRKDGTYAPGTKLTFRLTLKDGAGKRLHSQGSLPTYNEIVFGTNEPGIQYYRAFFDPTATYYRRKHRERMLISQIIGPAQRIQPIRSIVDMETFLGPADEQLVATLERDGVYSQFRTFPPANKLFGGAFDPNHAGWAAPVSDSWNFQLPANAEPGTYLVTTKGRRVYLGEDIPYTNTVEIQVGTKQHTDATLTTGPCNSCHSEGGELTSVLHANGNRATCAGCHAPLGFELEGPVFVRVHFIHSRSDRFDNSLAQCSKCHLTKESVQRTSKAACLSCHKSYPDNHVKKFGPIQNMYVGGGRESFQQCTGSCHTTHPESGL
ncbi:cytochrome c [Stigmatella aurantiaca]|nr:conserved uncharacterized protein [Stigmatella aurantiaca DW4/3-1]